MPSHGGRRDGGVFDGIYPYDLTELPETDYLYAACSVIDEAQALCAALFGSYVSLFSAGGATLALMTAISAAKELLQKEKIRCAVDRRSHRSVLNALILCGIEPIWFFPDGEVPDGDMVIFTSCDYYSEIADLAKISKICNNRISVVDNSHGGHLRFFDQGRLHPLSYPFDFVIDSAHKTMPVLTGGAILHASEKLRGRLEKKTLKRLLCDHMALFGSSSPSYLILASLDYARARLAEEGERVYRAMHGQISAFVEKYPELVFAPPRRDPFRVVLRGDFEGERLYGHLYREGIKAEFCDQNGVVFLVPYGHGEPEFTLLSEALDRYFENPAHWKKTGEERIRRPSIPEKAADMIRAGRAAGAEIPLAQARGRVAARVYSVFPPGIPLIVPGEVFDETIIRGLDGRHPYVRVLDS